MVNKSNISESNFKQLSILITQDGFLFYLQHQKAEFSKSLEGTIFENTLESNPFKHFKKRLKYIIKDYKFNSIKVAFADTNYSLVPKYYYKDQCKADYLKYNVQLLNNDHITTDFIEAIGVYQIYIPLMNYHNAILEEVEEFEYQHFTNILINLFKSKSLDIKQSLNVVIHSKYVDIIGFENQSFKLCNTFCFENDYDLAYYILFATQELHFDQKQMQLHIYHNLNDTTWLDVLKRYILNIKCERQILASLIP